MSYQNVSGTAYTNPNVAIASQEPDEQAMLAFPKEVTMDSTNDDILDQMRLNGGAAAFTIVRGFPELLAFRCFCAKCYISNLPDFQSEDFLKCTCCPFQQGFGCENWKAPTYCQLFCCACAGGGPSFITNWPAFCRLQCLFFKCGLENGFIASPQNQITSGEWCTSTCCCLHNDFGMKDICKIQWLCLLCTF
mmetsp:Transcript_6014/g.8339  ORF Transcript_6014/g.8339 Transcript_6014/m.8339 type:complete len:192 (+) Transcript_6014:115-690(+)